MSEELVQTDNMLTIKQSNGEDLAVGVVVPRDHPAAMTYLDDVRDYDDQNKDIYGQIKLSKKLYEWETVVGTVVDMYADFSHSEFKVQNVFDKKAMKLIEHFLKNVNKGNNNITTGMTAISRHYALEFYLAGNVFSYAKWADTKVESLKSNYKLPMTIVNLDPLIINIPEETVQFGNKKIYISFNRVFGQSYMNIDQRKRIIQALPTKVRNKFKHEQDIELDPQYTYHIKRKGRMYCGWGTPYLTRSFSAVASKRKLKALDDSTIDGIINSLTIFKVGHKDHRETWNVSRMRALKSLLNHPAASMQLVTSWDVEVEHIGPSGDVLKISDRYKDANTDILQALGVPLAVLTGEGTRAGDVWASVRFLTERLQEFRDEFKGFIEDLLKKIMEENGFEDIEPTIRYTKAKINIEDIRNIVLALYDKGLISKETTLEESGYSIKTEIDRRDKEKKEGVDDKMMRPDVAFSPAPGVPGVKGPAKKKVEKPKNGLQDNKRKITKTTEQNNKIKKPSPRIQGNARDRVVTTFSEILNETTTLKSAKAELIEFVSHSYGFNEKAAQSLFGVSKQEMQNIVNFATSNTDKSKPNKEAILERIEQYFQNH